MKSQTLVIFILFGSDGVNETEFSKLFNQPDPQGAFASLYFGP